MSSPTDYRIVLCEGGTLRSLGAKRWWWRIESTQNGQTVATSEVYSTAHKRDVTASRVGDASRIQVVRGK